MTKNELIEMLAKKTNTPVSQTKEILNGALEVIAGELKDNGSMNLYGFGTFRVRNRKARKGVNPITKQQTDIPASRTVSFKCGKVLRETVAN